MSDWDIEEIPNPHGLFYRVHRDGLNKGNLHPGIFRARQPLDAEGQPDATIPKQDWGMSTEWSEYSTAAKCRAGSDRSPAEDNGIVTLIVGDVRAVPPLTVEHTPNPKNRSHSDVFGLPVVNRERVKVRKRLFGHVDVRGWTIHPDAPVEDPAA